MTAQVAPTANVSVRALSRIALLTRSFRPPPAGAARRQRRGRRRVSTARAVYACSPLAEEELKPFLLKVAIVCEDLGEGMPAHGVHGNTVCETIVLIRALFIQRETLEE